MEQIAEQSPNMRLNLLRSKYVDYISAGIRYALTETGIKSFPDSVIILTAAWSDLLHFESIIGYKILVTNIESNYDFGIALPPTEDNNRLLKAFDEYQQLTDMED